MNTHKLLARPANGARLQDEEAAAPAADAETAAAPADTESAAAPAADSEAAAAVAAAGVGLDSMVPDSMNGFTPHLDKIHFPQK